MSYMDYFVLLLFEKGKTESKGVRVASLHAYKPGNWKERKFGIEFVQDMKV